MTKSEFTTQELAKIERVHSNLWEIWPTEPQHFTKWLAENIEEIGETLGMTLDQAQTKTEVQVGKYRLDILTWDLNSNTQVIIENQLGTTDHNHLGQLLTYAAGLDSGNVVWVTGDLGEEHRQVLDWLNRRTGEDTKFFGVIVELWRIGDSPPAPYFRVVASPNEWNPGTTAIGNGLNPSGKFRQSLRDTCDARGVKYSGKPGGNWHWLNFEYPVKNVRYEATWHKGKPGLQMIINMQGDDGRVWNQKMFNALELHRLEINGDIVESEEDESPVWQNTKDKADTRIMICRTGSIFNDTESWAEFQDWIIQKLHKFREVFTPRLQKLIQEEQPTIE